MRRQTWRVVLAAVAALALSAGLLPLALRPAEPAPVRPIDFPADGSEERPRIDLRLPADGAAPVSPLPPPRAGGGGDSSGPGDDDPPDDDTGDDDPPDDDNGGSDDRDEDEEDTDESEDD